MFDEVDFDLHPGGTSKSMFRREAIHSEKTPLERASLAQRRL